MRFNIKDYVPPVLGLRDALSVDGGKPPRLVVGTLLSFGVPEAADLLTFREGGISGTRWRLVARVSSGLTIVEAFAATLWTWGAEESTERQPEEMSSDWISLSRIRNVRAHETFLGTGENSSEVDVLAREWTIDIDGQDDPVRLKNDHHDRAGEFCRRLIASRL